VALVTRGEAQMYQANALSGLTGAGNVDTFGADSLVEGVVEALGSPRGLSPWRPPLRP
jgi:hypothetical protein